MCYHLVGSFTPHCFHHLVLPSACDAGNTLHLTAKTFATQSNSNRVFFFKDGAFWGGMKLVKTCMQATSVRETKLQRWRQITKCSKRGIRMHNAALQMTLSDCLSHVLNAVHDPLLGWKNKMLQDFRHVLPRFHSSSSPHFPRALLHPLLLLTGCLHLNLQTAADWPPSPNIEVCIAPMSLLFFFLICKIQLAAGRGAACIFCDTCTGAGAIHCKMSIGGNKANTFTMRKGAL